MTSLSETVPSVGFGIEVCCLLNINPQLYVLVVSISLRCFCCNLFYEFFIAWKSDFIFWFIDETWRIRSCSSTYKAVMIFERFQCVSFSFVVVSVCGLCRMKAGERSGFVNPFRFIRCSLVYIQSIMEDEVSETDSLDLLFVNFA